MNLMRRPQTTLINFLPFMTNYPTYYCNEILYPNSQCRKTVMTPLRNIQGTKTIKGYFFYENLRPNQPLDVLGHTGFVQKS